MLNLSVFHVCEENQSHCEGQLQNRKIKVKFVCPKSSDPIVFLVLHMVNNNINFQFYSVQLVKLLYSFFYCRKLIKFYNKFKYLLVMNKDRGAQIRLRQQQNKKLQQQTKRMEEELQKVKKIKQMEIQKIKLQQQMKALHVNQQLSKKKTVSNKTIDNKKQGQVGLRNYGAKVAVQNAKKNEKKMKKYLNQLKKFQESSDSNDQNQDDGENVRYFLQVMGMQKYFINFKQNKITSLQKLKAVKQQNLKKLDIPLKDMLLINKKLRTMGI